ncbi:MAG: hypothetical protein FJY07_12235, partial [Bacteroidetes bacterium]|nr:hypothetical protein [Bacteroidota bacterium]
MKRFLLLLFQVSIACSIFAEPVDADYAKTIALNAYFQKINTYHQPVSISNLTITDHFVISQDGQSVIYAFNFDNYGFILIAANDAIEPVLGYTFNCHYSADNQPDNFRGLLWQYGEHIRYLVNNKIAASDEISSQWNDLTSFNPASLTPKDSGKDIEPLVTMTWNQDWPYNYYCPADPAGPNGHVYVGCVATAMAQIMYYWRYPHQGSGSHSYYIYPYGQQTVNFGETTYDWDGMVDNSDTKVNLPMALIGYHAAVSVDMDFSPDGSGAYSDDVPYALKTYFLYSQQVSFKNRSNYQLATWKIMVQTELNALRPVYYSGQSPDGGHAFIIDGYHLSDDMYHFNFGWSGSDNGWYLITNAGGFTSNQGMVHNIFPADASYPYGCSTGTEQLSMVGSFEDGSGPQENYDGSANCSWKITPQTPQDSVSKITLNFVVLDTESEDMVTIYDGDNTSAPVLGTYSGTVPPTGFINSTGNKMLITLTADGDATTGTGYRVEYSSTQPNWCSGLTQLTEPSGSFGDGSGDWYYKNQSNCMWKIQPAWASDLTITFTEFNTEANTDLVKIYDASNNQLLATYSGEYTSGNMPDPITIPSGKLFMTFQSDGAV